MSLPKSFIEDCGGRRFEFLKRSIANELTINLPELNDERRSLLAESITAVVFRDERDAQSVYIAVMEARMAGFKGATGTAPLPDPTARGVESQP
jgi:hypothetical protein